MATEVDFHVGDDQILATSKEVFDSLHHIEVSDLAGLNVKLLIVNYTTRIEARPFILGGMAKRNTILVMVKGFFEAQIPE